MFRCQMLFSSLKSGIVNVGVSNSIKSSKKIPRTFKEKVDEFIKSPEGQKLRIFILGSTIVAYPIGALICNGPLIKKTFPWRFNVTYELPNKLKELVDEEYNNFLNEENRIKNDTVVRFSINKDESMHDSIAKSSLSIRFGAEIALPFYIQFNNIKEATEYCKKNLKTMKYLGEKLIIDWDSEKGQQILGSLVLSDRAKKFLITRDMYSNDGYQSYANRPLSWATWTTFSGIFTYVFHQKSKLCGGSALSFAVVYIILSGCAWLSSKEWHKLYRYLQDLHGDHESSKMTSDYCNGGREYYIKMLMRNRLLREFMKDGILKISPAGDIKNAVTSIITRYDLLQDVLKDDEEMKKMTLLDSW